MRDAPPARRCLLALVACVLLSPTAAPGAGTSEWGTLRDRQREALSAAASRIPRIEATELTGSTDGLDRAGKITKDRIARARGSLKGSGEGTGPVDKNARVAAVVQEWSPTGARRKTLRESSDRIQRELERANQDLISAYEALQAAAALVSKSGVPEALARVETAASEAPERLRARWQREHAARERERQQRERELGERERGVR